jgi:hypothetical protein
MTLCQAVLVCGRFAVVLQVNKVAGNFHFAAGHSYQSGSMHIHDMAPFADKALDFTHKVHSLSFGQPYPVRERHIELAGHADALRKGCRTSKQQQYIGLVSCPSL